MKKIFSLLIIISLTFTLIGCKTNTQLSDTKICLDTEVTITLYDNSSSDILKKCFSICNKYENIFSMHKKTSELYKLNHSDKTKPIKLSKELAYVINKGIYYSKLSNGSFDITIGSVSSLWDFTSSNPSLPNDSKIKEGLTHVNYSNIKIDNNYISYTDPNIIIDLGAIAKGYIGDKIKEYLLIKDVNSALLNLGGNIVCVNDKNGENFNIGIQDPTNSSKVLKKLSIDNLSVVTTGTYERFFEINGKKYHHILNPQTGYPYENNLSAVSIITSNSLEADCLSTVCFTMGKDKGLKLLNKLKKTEGIMVDNDNNQYPSKQFNKYVIK
ncbi:MAG: FAD:protein FMN transferase [Thomasclavelia sp.]|nr:FAD:protein FMN transferase [Thomasclavelia sp.]